MVGNGRGSSKKLAKGRAARALLDKLDDRVPHWEGNEVKPPITRACFDNYVCVLHKKEAALGVINQIKATYKVNIP